MPSYALLGATGSTGSAIIRCLLAEPPKDLTLKVFVRSKSKLLDAFPKLESTALFKANIIEGSLNDATAIRECLRDVDVIFGCIGSNAPARGMTLIYDTATSIVNALKELEAEDSNFNTPTVIQLRSSSLNPYAAMHWTCRGMAWFIFHHIYKDLDNACQLYALTAKESPELLNYIFVDPPSLHDAEGTTPTGHRLFLDEGTNQAQEPVLGYSDLGAAFCEVAARREEFYGMGVFVSATGVVNMTWKPLMGYMAMGVKTRVWG